MEETKLDILMALVDKGGFCSLDELTYSTGISDEAIRQLCEAGIAARDKDDVWLINSNLREVFRAMIAA